MKIEPSVAICIPNYNQAQFLTEAVTSAFRQTYSQIEVWVADDASTDETPKVMAELREKFPQMRGYRHSHNLGMVANIDWLYRQPQAEFIVRLDGDDVLGSHYVETLLKLMEKYPKAGYGHTAVEEIDQDGNGGKLRLLARGGEFQSPDQALNAAISGSRTAANIIMFRSGALKDVNFLENCPDLVEDYNIQIKLASAGYGNVYSSKILSYYRVWGGSQWSLERRITELEGLTYIYNETLLPAFKKRNFNPKKINYYRRQRAIDMISILQCGLAEEKRTHVKNMLKALGDSPQLSFSIKMLDWGLYDYLMFPGKVKIRLKQKIKEWIHKLRLLADSNLS